MTLKELYQSAVYDASYSVNQSGTLRAASGL
jgi:hypothetical protein